MRWSVEELHIWCLVFFAGVRVPDSGGFASIPRFRTSNLRAMRPTQTSPSPILLGANFWAVTAVCLHELRSIVVVYEFPVGVLQ